MDCIYTLASGRVDRYAWRTWAWFRTLREAMRAAEENFYDAAESGTYTHLVIEEVPHSQILNKTEWWYRWDESLEVWLPCHKPDEMQHVLNFTMG